VDQTNPPIGARILIIDDQEELASTIALLLTVAGYQSSIASTANAARLELLAVAAPDYIICDFHLGDGENGLELIDEFRNQYEHDIPAILMTGDKSPEIPARTAGMRHLRLMIKPFDGAALLEVLAELRGSVARDAHARTFPG